MPPGDMPNDEGVQGHTVACAQRRHRVPAQMCGVESRYRQIDAAYGQAYGQGEWQGQGQG